MWGVGIALLWISVKDLNKIARNILKSISIQKKEYRVCGIMTFNDEYIVEVENEEEARELALQYFEGDYCYTSIELSVEEA